GRAMVVESADGEVLEGAPEAFAIALRADLVVALHHLAPDLVARFEDLRGVFAERGLAQHRLGRLMAETDRRPDMAAAALVLDDHAALDEGRMCNRFGQRVDAPVADVECFEGGLPFGRRPLLELTAEKIDHRFLMRSGSTQAKLGQFRPAEGAQQIMDEFRLLPCEYQMAAVGGLVDLVEGRTPGGALMRWRRLAVLG